MYARCAIFLVVAMVAFFPIRGFAAGRLTSMFDTLSSILPGVGADHTITFFTPTGVNAASDTITLGFSDFSLSGVGVGDVQLSHGPSSGSETTETLASTAAAGVWGVSFSGTTVTLTAPTDAAAGEIDPNDRVIILIGENVVGGTNQITNPALAGDFELVIGGTFNDEGRMGLAIGNPDVAVSATVPATSTDGGGSGGGGTSPPLLFNIQASSTSFTTLLITWQTDEFATSAVDYGHTNFYASGTVSDLTLVAQHAIVLTGLTPCTSYHFRVRSVDQDGNAANSGDYLFAMPCDQTPPIITNIQVVNLTDTSAVILWTTNEPATSVTEYGLTPAYGATSSVPGFVTLHVTPIAGLIPDRTYHFRVRSTDPSNNTATGIDLTFRTEADTTPPANPVLQANSGDGNVLLTWTPPPDADLVGVRIVRKLGGFPTGPTDGLVIYQGLGTVFTDQPLINGVTYYYGAFAYDGQGNMSSGGLASATPLAPGQTLPPAPPTPPGTPPGEPFPPLPPGTVPSGPGVIPTPPTPGATIVVQLFGSGGALPLARGSDGTIGVLAGGTIEVRVPADSLNGSVSLVAVSIDGATYALAYDEQLHAFVGRIVVPTSPGRYELRAQAIFTDGRNAQLSVLLRVQEPGRVFERPLIGGVETPIPGAIVRLFRFEGGERAPWDGGATGQPNPITTDGDGRYAFEVPPGRYYVEVRKEGYWTYFSPPIFVDGNVFAIPVELVRIPPPPFVVISPTSTPPEQAVAAAEQIAEQVISGLKLFRIWLTSEPVRAFFQNVLIPLLVVFALLNAIAAIPLFSFFAFIQYLLLLPLILFAMMRHELPKRRGVAYDAFSKRPIDLAIIRLIHAPTGLMVRLRVTDRFGRFWFKTQPGDYRLEAIKPGFVFPSTSLRGKTSDGIFSNLYHGSRFVLEKPATLTHTIPMDSIIPAETSRQIRLRTRLRSMQNGVASGGAFLGLFAFILLPSWGMAAAASIPVALYALFRRLVRSDHPKKSGRVLNTKTKKPIANAIIRLYEAKSNRLVDVQATDRKGRYGFFAAHNRFYMTVEASRYAPARFEEDMTDSSSDVLAKDIHLIRR